MDLGKGLYEMFGGWMSGIRNEKPLWAVRDSFLRLQGVFRCF